jgi:hypothetical protein
LTDDTVSIEVPKASYTLANRKRDGLPEVLVVNEALLIFPHIDIFPWHLRVELRAQDLADQGMPTSQESLLLRDSQIGSRRLCLKGEQSTVVRMPCFLLERRGTGSGSFIFKFTILSWQTTRLETCWRPMSGDGTGSTVWSMIPSGLRRTSHISCSFARAALTPNISFERTREG